HRAGQVPRLRRRLHVHRQHKRKRGGRSAVAGARPRGPVLAGVPRSRRPGAAAVRRADMMTTKTEPPDIALALILFAGCAAPRGGGETVSAATFDIKAPSHGLQAASFSSLMLSRTLFLT